MIKTKTFVVKGTTSYNGTDDAAEQLDDMINSFIEGKTAESSSFKVIKIQYSPTITTSDRGVEHWFPSAMLVYEA